MIINEAEFVQTIDYQLQKIKKDYEDVVELAIEAQKTSLTEIPGGQILGLPAVASDLVRDIQAYLEEI